MTKNYFLKKIKNKITRYYVNQILFRLTHYKLNLSELFVLMEPYDYVVFKVDSPYMPKDFPDNYPIGKDLDIISMKKDFLKINNILLSFAKKYENHFNLKVISEQNKFRIRFEKFGQLYYQLDNSFYPENISLAKISQQAIQERKTQGLYYKMKTKYELILRLNELRENPSKSHHANYIIANSNLIDKNLIPEYLLPLYMKIVENKFDH